MKIQVVRNVLKANDAAAEKNRERFKEAGVFAVNFISSPGSGKTALLAKTMALLLPGQRVSVAVGDLETTRDAERLAPYACRVIQINTGMSCHLYANQITESLSLMDLGSTDYFFVENVGNMVCPGEFDLGENAKVVLLSVPEGDDKVAKYPTIFRAADLVLLSKADLAGILSFDLDRVRSDLAKLNGSAPLLKISSLTGEGMEDWLAWLKEKRVEKIGSTAKFVAGQ